jgi:hypothetical protein
MASELYEKAKQIKEQNGYPGNSFVLAVAPSLFQKMNGITEFEIGGFHFRVVRDTDVQAMHLEDGSLRADIWIECDHE